MRDRAIIEAAGATLWLTGRPASGKTTIATSLQSALRRLHCDASCIDGDDLRRTIHRDLGFSKEDRAENARRAGEYALSMTRLGKVAIVSLVSPYALDRQRVRDLHRGADVPFVEVYVECPLAVAEARDPKGLYRRARAGEVTGVTGIDDPYEAPTAPDVVLDTSRLTVQAETTLLLEHLRDLMICRC